jgi:hypothetical protein
MRASLRRTETCDIGINVYRYLARVSVLVVGYTGTRSGEVPPSEGRVSACGACGARFCGIQCAGC